MRSRRRRCYRAAAIAADALLGEEQLEGARAATLGHLECRLWLIEASVCELEVADVVGGCVHVSVADALLVGAEIVPDGVVRGDGGSEQRERLLRVVEGVEVGGAEVAEVCALAVPVANLAADGERGVVVLDGLVVLPEAAVRVAEVAEPVALVLPVANLAADGERGGVVLDGLVVLPEAVVRVAEAASRGANHHLVFHRLAQAEQLLVRTQRPPCVTTSPQLVALLQQRPRALPPLVLITHECRTQLCDAINGQPKLPGACARRATKSYICLLYQKNSM